MKNQAASIAVITVFLTLTPAVVLAQAGVPSTPPPNVELRPVPPSSAEQPTAPTYELKAKWNERMSADVMSVPLKNESDKPMEIIGVQASGGVFIADFPAKIAPGKEDRLSVVHVASDNTEGDLDIIRVYTDQGIKEILIKIAREKAAAFDTRELTWKAGDPAEAKTATLTVSANTAVPTKARVTGGHSAVLEKATETTWKIKVTPESTAKSGRFAVFIEFDKPLPGTAPVILGVIQPKE